MKNMTELLQAWQAEGSAVTPSLHQRVQQIVQLLFTRLEMDLADDDPLDMDEFTLFWGAKETPLSVLMKLGPLALKCDGDVSTRNHEESSSDDISDDDLTLMRHFLERKNPYDLSPSSDA